MKFYNVTFSLINGEKISLYDIEADSEDEARGKAIERAASDMYIIKAGERTHQVYKQHLVQIIIEEVDSPKDRSEQQRRNLDAISKIL